MSKQLRAILSLILVALLHGCSSLDSPKNSAALSDLDDDQAKAKIKELGRPLCIEFCVDWLAPCCVAVKPTLDEVELTYKGKVPVLRLDADKTPVLMEQFGITTVPALCILTNRYPDGKTMIGAKSKAEMSEFINDVLRESEGLDTESDITGDTTPAPEATKSSGTSSP